MQFTETKLYAGATWNFTESMSDYPASEGWTLNIIIKHKTDAAATLTSTPDSDDFAFSISSTTTADFIKRDYKYQVIASKSGEVELYEEGDVVIYPLLSATGDYRTDNEIMLDAIIATMKGIATREQRSLKFADREFEYLTLDELIKAKKYYEAEVRKERNIASGKKAIPRILERY